MKKKTLLFGAALMLTAMFFTGCKSAVENALSVTCYTCTHTDPVTYPDVPEACDALGTTTVTDSYKLQGYTCTLN
ncbi:MAG: hypothetical protein OEX22_13225 [Cyclobacteriaceae bacterium]|nr:hypothetical protein [Cyclobacteriaceae bacterium]